MPHLVIDALAVVLLQAVVAVPHLVIDALAVVLLQAVVALPAHEEHAHVVQPLARRDVASLRQQRREPLPHPWGTLLFQTHLSYQLTSMTQAVESFIQSNNLRC